MAMKEKQIALKLSASEALVLFEWLSRSEDSKSISVEYESEQKVLWVLEAQLEKSLSAQFAPNYNAQVENARRIVDASR